MALCRDKSWVCVTESRLALWSLIGPDSLIMSGLTMALGFSNPICIQSSGAWGRDIGPSQPSGIQASEAFIAATVQGSMEGIPPFGEM